MSSLEHVVDHPWDGRAQQLVRDLDLDSRRLRRVAQRYAKWEHKASHHRLARPVFNAYRAFLSYAVGGGMEDSIASKISSLTGIDKMRAQRVNAALALVEQSAAVVGGYVGLDAVDHGADSLYVTVPVALANAGWSVYRYLDRGPGAKPGIGYGSAVAHGVAYLKRSVSGGLRIGPVLTEEAHLRSLQDGCGETYARCKILLEGSLEAWREASAVGKGLAASASSLPFLRELWKR